MRSQCPDGHWFTFPGPCPYNDCGYVPEDIPPPPPARREVEEQVARVDRDALRVMPDDRVSVTHADGFAAARKALAEAEFRKKRSKGAA